MFDVHDAARVGVSRQQLKTLVATGEFVRLRRGALAERDVVELCALDSRALHALHVAAALLTMAQPAAAVKASAACVLGLDLPLAVPAEPLLVRPAAQKAGGRNHAAGRILRAGPEDWHVTTVAGVSTCDAARTVVDCARTWRTTQAVAVADSALRLFGAELQRVMLAIVENCWRWPGGGRRAQQVILQADPRSESVLETLGRLTMVADGLPRPATQCWVGEFGPEFRADYGYEEQRTLGEADGRVKYMSPDVLWEQARREERLHDLGFEVVRFDYAATTRVGELGGRFRQAFARAGKGRGRFWPDPDWWSPGVRRPTPRGVAPGEDWAWWLWPADDDGQESQGAPFPAL